MEHATQQTHTCVQKTQCLHHKVSSSIKAACAVLCNEARRTPEQLPSYLSRRPKHLASDEDIRGVSHECCTRLVPTSCFAAHKISSSTTTSSSGCTIWRSGTSPKPLFHFSVLAPSHGCASSSWEARSIYSKTSKLVRVPSSLKPTACVVTHSACLD